MKHGKIFGLAAVAAMALVAFGASTTSAANLYSTGVKLPVGTTIHMTQEAGTSALIEGTDGSSLLHTCPASTLHGTIGSTGGSMVTGNIGTLTWSAACSSTIHTIAPGTLHVDSAGTVSGTGTIVTFALGLSCRYGTGTGIHLGTLKTGTLNINAILDEQTPLQFLCPDTTRLTASYVFTSPHDVTAGA